MNSPPALRYTSKLKNRKLASSLKKEIIVFVYPEKGEVAYAINGESGENILNFIGWAMQQKNHKNGTFCFDRNVNYHEKLFEYFSL